MSRPTHIIDREQAKFASNNSVTVTQRPSGYFNSLKAKKTTIPDTADTLIEIPEGITQFTMYHRSDSILYIGEQDNVIAPIYKNEFLTFEMQKNNENNIYGKSSSGNIDVYIIGVARE